MDKNILVAVFSASGVTRAVGEEIARIALEGKVAIMEQMMEW